MVARYVNVNTLISGRFRDLDFLFDQKERVIETCLIIK